MADSFWALPDATTMRTPLSILREQAAALTQQTHGVLVGEAAAKAQDSGRMLISLDIIAPGLNDYRYRVIAYLQPLEMYPGTLSALGSYVGDIRDEAGFVEAMKKALSSAKMKNVLTSLITQASDA